MALKLKTPVVNESQEPATSAETARFISSSTRTPKVGKPKLVNFRLPLYFDDILETESTRTGLARASVIKAALVAYEQMDENQKNNWLLEAAKIK